MADSSYSIPNDSQSTALYRNSKGTEVTHGSYSARQTFKKCPREFEAVTCSGLVG